MRCCYINIRYFGFKFLPSIQTVMDVLHKQVHEGYKNTLSNCEKIPLEGYEPSVTTLSVFASDTEQKLCNLLCSSTFINTEANMAKYTIRFYKACLSHMEKMSSWYGISFL